MLRNVIASTVVLAGCAAVSAGLLNCGTSSGSSGSGGQSAGSGPSGNATSGTTASGAQSSAGSSASGSTSTGAGGTAASTGAGGMPVKPFVCPETDPFNQNGKKLPNSNVIQDKVISASVPGCKDDGNGGFTCDWTADKIWVLTDDMDFGKAVVTIEPGTTICIADGKSLTLGSTDPAEAHFNGTADKHVTITVVPMNGNAFFGGLLLNSYKGTTISYLDIFFGGIGGGGATFAFDILSTAAGTDASKALLVDHLRVDQVQNKGIGLHAPQGIDAASLIEFDGYAPQDANSPPLYQSLEFSIEASGTVTPSNFKINAANIPAAVKFVNILPHAGSQLNQNVAWQDLGLPYRITGDGMDVFNDQKPAANAATFTINGGVTLQLAGRLRAGDAPTSSFGNIVIAGSAQKPVVITSIADNPMPPADSWSFIGFEDGLFDPATSKIDHAKLMYGGAQLVENTVSVCAGAASAMVIIGGANSGMKGYQGPHITNSELDHGVTGSYGIAWDISPCSNTPANLDPQLVTEYQGNTFNDVNGPMGMSTPDNNCMPVCM